jgi:hypothetical protein
LKTAAAPRELLDQQSEELQLTSELRSLLEPFLPAKSNHILTGLQAT